MSSFLTATVLDHRTLEFADFGAMDHSQLMIRAVEFDGTSWKENVT